MIPQANITAWRAIAPWADDAQVEQDLVLSRAVVELFSELDHKLINPDQVIARFHRYMQHEGHAVTRAQFEENLHDKEGDPEFMDDIKPLLNPAVHYSSAEAMKIVRDILVTRIPGEPWHGEG